MDEDKNQNEDSTHSLYEKMSFVDINGDPIDDDDEEDEEDEEQELDEEAKTEEEANKRVIKNKFKKIVKRAPKRLYPHITKEEKKIVNQMAKIDKRAFQEFVGVMVQAKQRFFTQVKSAISGSMPFLGVILMVAVIVLGVIVIIATLFPWLAGGDSNSGMTSLNGIKADKFYGARMIYKDDTLARKTILTNYTEIVAELKTEVETANSKIEITIALPSEENYYDNFNEQSFQTDYAHLYQLFDDFSALVLTTDIQEGEPDPSTLTLTQKLDEIKYFGIDTNLATTGTNNFALILSSQINNNDLYNFDSSDGLDVSTVESLITSKATAVLTQSKYNVRTEKLFIKDYLVSDDKGLEGITKQTYVAMIFMPKTNVTFTGFSFIVANTENIDLNNFMTINANGQTLTLTNEEFTKAEGDTPASYMFDTGTVNVSASVYTDFSSDGAVTNATSLLGIATNDSLNAEQFLTNADGTTIKTFKSSGVVVEFNANEPFMFCENETNYE